MIPQVPVPLTESEFNCIIAALEGIAPFIHEADGVNLLDLLTKIKHYKEQFPHD
jgi:hypothetical protein